LKVHAFHTEMVEDGHGNSFNKKRRSKTIRNN
jgi:hypothetical protein